MCNSVFPSVHGSNMVPSVGCMCWNSASASAASDPKEEEAAFLFFYSCLDSAISDFKAV